PCPTCARGWPRCTARRSRAAPARPTPTACSSSCFRAIPTRGAGWPWPSWSGMTSGPPFRAAKRSRWPGEPGPGRPSRWCARAAGGGDGRGRRRKAPLQRAGGTVSDRTDLLEAIKAKAVVRGDFVLSSGQRADWYVDLRRILLDGRLAPLAGRVMLDLTADLA